MCNMIAVYAGSFDPFTNGHLQIVKEAAYLFDTVIVVIANNASKVRKYDLEQMRIAIRECLKNNNLHNCLVVVHDGLIADYCAEHHAKHLIRGLRNTSDYMYEENIAKINKEINPDLKTIYFRAENETISSSMVRELMKYGKDISQYVPEEILTILKN